MPTDSHPNLKKPHYTSSWSNTFPKEYSMPTTSSTSTTSGGEVSSSSGPPAIQPAPSAGSASLAYSLDTEAMDQLSGNSGNSNSNQQQQQQQLRAREEQQQLPPRIQPSPTADESVDYSIYSSGEMSAEQYYASHQSSSQYNQYTQEQDGQFQQQQFQQQQGLQTVNEYQNPHGEASDATPTVHDMHRKLLYLLSHHELFSDAIDWQSKVDRGLDPSRPTNDGDDNDGNGIKSFDNEFEDQSRLGADEHKDEVVTEDGTENDGQTTATTENDDASSKYQNQKALLPPLPHQIFAPDAEVVLPQALTASQLFGIERVTGIELEAAAGIIGLSQLFLRWLALMPEGDHMNVIDPPGLTVMRISGGRYRVTGAHRVVWRWMNKFSPASMFAVPPVPTTNSLKGEDDEDGEKDTDFDFGDLVTMTIIDVFETDADGKLLSYCPTFDNRAVHKTQEVTERLRKGASHLKERMEVIGRSPAGKSVNKVRVLCNILCMCLELTHDAIFETVLSILHIDIHNNNKQQAAGNLGKMSISAAFAVGNIVKNKIEEEIHKHQHQSGGGDGENTSLEDAVGGEDVNEEEEEEDDAKLATSKDEHSAATPGG
ncbi:hypothetical protein ACHAXR_003212, partial [Thalassiosira sp. AJA248-18]